MVCLILRNGDIQHGGWVSPVGLMAPGFVTQGLGVTPQNDFLELAGLADFFIGDGADGHVFAHFGWPVVERRQTSLFPAEPFQRHSLLDAPTLRQRCAGGYSIWMSGAHSYWWMQPL